MREILVVEDKPLVAPLLQSKSLLTETQELHLQSADRLDTALRVMRETAFAVIFLNLRLAGGTGLETYSKVQAVVPDTPIIGLVNLQDESIAAEAVQAGAWDYLILDHLTLPRLVCALRNAIEYRQLTRLPQEMTALERDIEAQKHAGNALRESEASLNALIETIPGSVWSVDRNYRLLAFNTRFREHAHLALEREVRQGENILGEGPEAIYEDWRTYYERGLRGESFSIVTQTVPPLTPQSVEYHFNPIRLGNGSIVGVTIYGEDITERKRTEAALRGTERYNRSILDALAEHIAVLDETGTIVGVNRAWRDFAHENGLVLPNAGVGSNYLAVCDSAQGQGTGAATAFALGIRSVLRGECALYEQEYDCHGPDIKRWFIGRVTRFKEPGPERIVVTHHNITERVQAEEEVRVSQARYHALVEAMAEAAVMHDAQGTIVACNAQAERLLGLSADQILGRTAFDPRWHIIHEDGSPFPGEARPAMVTLRTGRPCSDVVMGIKSAEGDFAWVLVNSRPVIEPGNSKPRGVVITAVDITGRKREEEKWHNLFEILPVGISLVTPDHGVTEFNKALSEILHITEEGLLKGRYRSRRYWRSDHTPMAPEEFPSLRAVREQTTVRDVEIGVEIEDGTMIWTNVSAAPLSSQNGSVTVTSDITDRKRAEVALLESEQKFHALLRQAPLPSAIYRLIYDAQGQVVDWEISDINTFGAANMGLTVEAAIGQRMVALFGAETMAPHFEISRQVAATGQPVQFESYFEGNGRYYLVSDYLIDATHYANVNIDITDRKQAEKALRESEERFRVIADFTYDWEYWMGIDGNLTYCSPSCQRVTGYSAETFRQQPNLLQSMVHADDRERVTDHLRAETRGPQVGGFDFRIVTASGEERWINHFCQPVYTADGRCLGQRASNRDITARKQAEAALRESEEKYRALFDASLDATLLTAPDGRVFAANPAACQMFGYSEEEFQRLGRGALVDVTDPRLATALEERARTGRFIGELTQIRKDGTRFPGEISTAQFTDKDGGVKTSLVIRDITGRKEAETKLAQSAEQLRALSQYLQTAREEERKAIAREIHDELGQALTVLKMDLAALARQIPVGYSHLTQMTTAMSGRVDDIIRTVRSVASQLRPSMLDDLGLAAALEWQAEGFQRRTGIACEIDLPQPSLALSQEVTTAIFRIVQEATTNIACHSRATRVRIRLTVQADRLHLIVHDNGVGLTAQQLDDPHAFGLIGMRERAFALGGRLTFESAQGLGTTIQASIPLPAEPIGKDLK